MRRNIFEVNCETGMSDEISILDSLVHKDKIAIYRGLGNPIRGTIEYYADSCFHEWKGRGTYVSCSDMRKRLQIDSIVQGQQSTFEDFITYFEYVIAVFGVLQFCEYSEVLNDRLSVTAMENVGRLLERYNLRMVDLADDRVIVVQRDPVAIAVAESSDDEQFSSLILRYHHHLLKGNLQEKGMILAAIAKKFEATKHVLKGEGFATLMSNIGLVLNNLNIRHTAEGKSTLFSDLKDSEVELLYDDLYDMMLLWFQAVNYYENIEKRVAGFRKGLGEARKTR